MVRANGLLLVPGYAFRSGAEWHICSVAVVNHFFPNGYTDEEFDQKEDEMNQMAAAMRTDTSAKENPKAKNRAFKTASHNIEAFSDQFPGLRNWLIAVLESAIIQAWTAFEVLAADLHQNTLAKHPECFPREALTGKKYTFRQLRTLRESYERAFGGDLAICSLVTSKEVKALALLRHLLVHCRGVVDTKHKEQCAEAPIVNIFDKWGVNQSIQIDGVMVRALLDPVITKGYELARRVDEWIDKNKPL